METNNEWMNDPELKNIDRAKLDFLGRMFVQSTSINSTGTQEERQKNMMAFLLSLSKLSRENNISFQKEEVELIFSVLKKYSTSDDIAKMQKVSSFFHSR
ncbi:MAG: hypothetical protein HFH75_07170 [Lachnospiraceae bacterium]|jgi:hypothetical protein|nr:hypothetical protein [Lachnospiraceae bacterium]MCI8967348.1 hypothetical protein [Lachnospiraceae bacterium]MDE6919817.1 hypothetical protein [Lachnospiraceae bacterium]MDE6990377.1 hypothetical protein [Lachnospiraceae bacterium]MDE7001544.1 hypothetical protein [Lachnospiraceae bacterium]